MDLQANKTDGIVLPVTNKRISAGEWNQLAGSCMEVITEAGLTPDATDNKQLLNAFKAITPGSSTTQTWFKNQTGATLDISSLSGNVYKVFKNGILLEEGFTSTTERAYTSVSDKTKLLLIYPGGQSTIPFTNYSSWSIQFRASSTSSYGSIPGWIGTEPNQNEWNSFFIASYSGGLNSHIWAKSSTTNNWLIGASSLGWSTSQGQIIDVLFEFTGTAYNCYKKNATDASFGSPTYTYNSTTKIEDSDAPIWVFNTSSSSVGYRVGTVYMNYVKFIADGVTLFDGATAVKGTDFTVDSAWTETVTTTASDPNNYNISGSTITFATPLISTDKIMVETK